MANPSTIWAQLAIPFPAGGSIPYVDSDDATIVTNVSAFNFDPAKLQLNVQTNGDSSGVDAINIYGAYDAYWTQGAAKSASFSLSSSRGTGSTPLILQSGDLIGDVTGWACTGPNKVYQPVAAVRFYVKGGNSAGTLGIGGSLRFAVQPDNVGTGPVEFLEVTAGQDFVTLVPGVQLGVAQPVVVGTVQNTGSFAGVRSNFFIQGATTPGTVSCNGSYIGKVKIPAGTNTVTVNNVVVTPNTVVQCQIETLDATAKSCVVVPGNGSFVITTNANATAITWVNFVIYPTDT